MIEFTDVRSTCAESDRICLNQREGLWKTSESQNESEGERVYKNVGFTSRPHHRFLFPCISPLHPLFLFDHLFMAADRDWRRPDGLWDLFPVSRSSALLRQRPPCHGQRKLICRGLFSLRGLTTCLSQVFFLSGLSLVIGLRNSFNFFFQRHKIKVEERKQNKKEKKKPESRSTS
jgi:hypothetical protein